MSLPKNNNLGFVEFYHLLKIAVCVKATQFIIFNKFLMQKKEF